MALSKVRSAVQATLPEYLEQERAISNIFDIIGEQASKISDSGYLIVDDFMSQNTAIELRDLILRHHRSGELRSARIGFSKSKKHSPEIRGDSMLWLDAIDRNKYQESLPSLIEFESALEQLAAKLKTCLRVSLNSYEAHLAYYPSKHYYRRHRDQQADGERQLAIVYYLNQDWKLEHEGQLELYLDKGSVVISPSFNRLIIFRADIDHEVLQTNAPRVSIVGWLRRSRP